LSNFTIFISGGCPLACNLKRTTIFPSPCFTPTSNGNPFHKRSHSYPTARIINIRGSPIVPEFYL
jgi:hypothetical protein